MCVCEREREPARLDLTNVGELRLVTSPSDVLLAAVRAAALLLAPRGKPAPSAEALSWKELKKMFVRPDQAREGERGGRARER